MLPVALANAQAFNDGNDWLYGGEGMDMLIGGLGCPAKLPPARKSP